MVFSIVHVIWLVRQCDRPWKSVRNQRNKLMGRRTPLARTCRGQRYAWDLPGNEEILDLLKVALCFCFNFYSKLMIEKLNSSFVSSHNPIICFFFAFKVMSPNLPNVFNSVTERTLSPPTHTMRGELGENASEWIRPSERGVRWISVSADEERDHSASVWKGGRRVNEVKSRPRHIMIFCFTLEAKSYIFELSGPVIRGLYICGSRLVMKMYEQNNN